MPAENNSVVETPPKMSKENLEEKVRFREYRLSQSPLDRDNRLCYNRVRKEVERCSESSEIRAECLEKIKISMRNL